MHIAGRIYETHSEEEMKNLRLALEEINLDWHERSLKKMFGSHCFLT